MKKVKIIVGEDGVGRPDIPAGQQFPPNDPNLVAVVGGEGEYVLYELGDEIPAEHRPKVHTLRELSDSTVVWRYMDFAKLYTLLSKQALYFTPGYILRGTDPYELRIPTKTRIESREQMIRAYRKAFPEDDEGLLRILDGQDQDFHVLYATGISCWHINEKENNALWRTFVGSGAGVAIKSTIGAIKDSIDTHRRYICMDQVEYIDYENESFKQHPSAIGFEQLFHKSSFYSYEQELRLVYTFPTVLKEQEIDPTVLSALPKEALDQICHQHRLTQEHLLSTVPYVPVNLSTLIHDVVVAPWSGPWLVEAVRNLHQTFGLSNVPIRQSRIDRFPE